MNQSRWEDMTPAQRKRNGRIIALVLGLSTIVSVAFLTYAFVVRKDAEKAAIQYELKIHGLEAELTGCVREAAAARDEAARAMAAAEEARRKP